MASGLAMTWTFEQARPLIIKLEMRLPAAGCHVALTGGVLYKFGQRKDLDLIVYRIRQMEIQEDKMVAAFKECEVEIIKRYGWMYKARYRGNGIDILIPESGGSEKYPSPQDDWVHNLLLEDF